ncbi:hypothetical protein JMJ35_000850 [Cladonia borealis]|uniref:F-box domain-containing protein n=1 Tax=Cladonia borealis TaxID=184061 RepID=A0AA39R7A2_9LECA|nr:hypothetical protein JMJ35_000850 [Cladonia borealis]
MDHATSSLASPPASNTKMQSQLPPEILLTIFEDVQDQRTLRHLRLVSSRFEELVTPIWCREVILKPELVAQYGLNHWLGRSRIPQFFRLTCYWDPRPSAAPGNK